MDSCQLEILSQSKTTTIKYCPDCEEVHLIMGPISLRFTKDHYQRFSRDIAQGLQQLNSPNAVADIFSQAGFSRLHS